MIIGRTEYYVPPPPAGYRSQPHAPPHGHRRGSVRYEIVKPSFIRVSRSKHKPSLEMEAGNFSSRQLGACYLPNASSYSSRKPKTFRLGLGDPSNVHWAEMHYGGGDKYGWTFPFVIPNTGQTVRLAWHKSNKIAVDGGWDEGVTTILENLSRRDVGSLQISVDLGPSFEQAAVLLLVSVCEQKEMEGDMRSSQQRMACAAAPAAASGLKLFHENI